MKRDLRFTRFKDTIDGTTQHSHLGVKKKLPLTYDPKGEKDTRQASMGGGAAPGDKVNKLGLPGTASVWLAGWSWLQISGTSCII